MTVDVMSSILFNILEKKQQKSIFISVCFLNLYSDITFFFFFLII